MLFFETEKGRESHNKNKWSYTGGIGKALPTYKNQI